MKAVAACLVAALCVARASAQWMPMGPMMQPFDAAGHLEGSPVAVLLGSNQVQGISLRSLFASDNFEQRAGLPSFIKDAIGSTSGIAYSGTGEAEDEDVNEDFNFPQLPGLLRNVYHSRNAQRRLAREAGPLAPIKALPKIIRATPGMSSRTIMISHDSSTGVVSVTTRTIDSSGTGQTSTTRTLKDGNVDDIISDSLSEFGILSASGAEVPCDMHQKSGVFLGASIPNGNISLESRAEGIAAARSPQIDGAEDGGGRQMAGTSGEGGGRQMAETSGKQEDDPHEDGSWLLEGRGGVDRARDVDSDGVLEGDGVVDEYDAEAVRRAFDESNGHGHDADGTDELRSGEEDDAEMARDAGVVDGITVAAPHEASPLPFGPVQTQDAQVEQAADPVAAAKAAVADEAKAETLVKAREAKTLAEIKAAEVAAVEGAQTAEEAVGQAQERARKKKAVVSQLAALKRELEKAQTRVA